MKRETYASGGSPVISSNRKRRGANILATLVAHIVSGWQLDEVTMRKMLRLADVHETRVGSLRRKKFMSTYKSVRTCQKAHLDQCSADQ